MEATATTARREPWNKGNNMGKKAPFRLRAIWAIRVGLQMHDRVGELALFDLGIDSKAGVVPVTANLPKGALHQALSGMGVGKG